MPIDPPNAFPASLYRPAALRPDDSTDGRPVRMRTPRWPMYVVILLLGADLLFAATFTVATFASAVVVDGRGTDLTAVAPARGRTPRNGNPAEIPLPDGGVVDARVVATRRIDTETGRDNAGIPPGFPVPVLLVVLRVDGATSLAAPGAAARIEVSRTSLIGLVPGMPGGRG